MGNRITRPRLETGQHRPLVVVGDRSVWYRLAAMAPPFRLSSVLPRLTAGALVAAVTATAAFSIHCDSSSPQDINYGKDVGADFDAPLRDAATEASSADGATGGSAGSTGGTLGTGGTASAGGTTNTGGTISAGGAGGRGGIGGEASGAMAGAGGGATAGAGGTATAGAGGEGGS
jgi:hypothetical protein